MRILYITGYYKPAYIYGGPVQSISTLCEGLGKIGAEVVVFTTNANKTNLLEVPLNEPVNVDGVEVWYYPLFFKGLKYFYSPALDRAIVKRSGEFDIIIAESLWGFSAKAVVKGALDNKVPYIVPVRGQLFPWALRKSAFKKKTHLQLFGRKFLNNAAAIHCTDKVEADAVTQLNLKPPTFIVPNAIDIDKINQPREYGYLHDAFRIPEQGRILIFLGRIIRIKRPDIAVSVLAAAQTMDRETHLVFVGSDEDDLVSALQEQAQNAGCAEKIHFTGLLDKETVLKALLDSDLLLMPSEIQENFGMAALEALAIGKPVLVSNGIPVGQWASKAKAGCVVPCDAKSFEKAALELLSKPEQLKQMGLAGQKLTQQEFGIHSVAKKMLAQLKTIRSTKFPLEI